jgi:hypothetical protein
MERPFNIGDWLELEDGRIGAVVDMNWRATRLRAWDNTTLVVPNSSLASQSMKNLHGESHVYAPWYFVKIPAEVDPRYATELLLEAAMSCESVMKMPPPTVRLADATSLPYSYMVWVHLKSYPACSVPARSCSGRSTPRCAAPASKWHRRCRSSAPAAPVSNAEPPTLELALKSMEFAARTHAMTKSPRSWRAASTATSAPDSAAARGGRQRCLLRHRRRVGGKRRAAAGRLAQGAGGVRTGQLLRPRRHADHEPSIEEFSAKSDVTLIRIDLDCLRAWSTRARSSRTTW